MEDKELQELFEAKRTNEANRRRQDELRRMIAVEKGKRKVESSRRLWPVWFGAAAAAVLLLIIVSPMMRTVGTQRAVPEIAQAKTIPQVPINETLPLADTVHRIPTKHTVGTRRAVSARDNIMIARNDEPLALADTARPVPTVTKREPRNTHTVDTLSTLHSPLSTPQPPTSDLRPTTVHRRTSTSMVCSNCNINNVPSQSSAFQDFLAATFGAESNTPFTLKSIEF